jgi:hypothetical protein
MTKNHYRAPDMLKGKGNRMLIATRVAVVKQGLFLMGYTDAAGLRLRVE